MVRPGVALIKSLNRFYGEPMTFGILTLATPGDYRKAIGLALSARVCNPGVPLAVACSPKLRPILAPFFDYVVDENPSLKGFEHKVHLDRYSPFENTFFFDSDVLLFRDLKDIVHKWQGQSYTACGIYMEDGFGTFGLDRRKVLEKINKKKLIEIGGAGHAYFRKPECYAVFDLAREITTHYKDYAGDIAYADEDVMNIAMTILGLVPAPRHEISDSGSDFLSRYMSATPGTIQMDATIGKCSYISRHSSRRTDPYMMHFAANEAPFPYAFQLRRLYKKFGVNQKGLLKEAFKDYYVMNMWWPLKKFIKNLLVTAHIIYPKI